MGDFIKLTFKVISLSIGMDLTDVDIDSIIRVQHSRLIEQTRNNTENGFLISKFDRSEVKKIYHDGGTFVLGIYKGEVIGFILVTSNETFNEILKEGSYDGFDPCEENDHCSYLYQIAISSEYNGRGLGTALIQEAQRLFPNGLVADILVEPVCNIASINVFRKNGFSKIGVLGLSHYRDFGELKSEVIHWNGEKSKILTNVQ